MYLSPGLDIKLSPGTLSLFVWGQSTFPLALFFYSKLIPIDCFLCVKHCSNYSKKFNKWQLKQEEVIQVAQVIQPEKY